MIIVSSYHFLSQNDGDFVGAAEILEGRHFANLWDENGTVDFRFPVSRATGDKLFALLVDAFTTRLEIDKSDVYLTDEDESQILFAF